jgi:hypothetical protein
MATLYQPDGRTKEMEPANGNYWTLAELQALVGGYPNVVSTVDHKFMVINDLGKVQGLELNIPATRLYIHGRKDVIVGNAVVVDTRLELDGPEEVDGEVEA